MLGEGCRQQLKIRVINIRPDMRLIHAERVDLTGDTICGINIKKLVKVGERETEGVINEIGRAHV